MTNQIKITKTMVLEAVKAYIENVEVVATVDDVEVTGKDVIEYCDLTIEQLSTKAAKAKIKAAEDKMKSDALKDTVRQILTTEFQDADKITSQINVEDITRSKVIPKLTALIKEGVAVKDIEKNGKTKRTVYKLATVDEKIEEIED